MLMAGFKIARTLYSAVLQSADLVRRSAHQGYRLFEPMNQGVDLLAPCEELKTLLDYLAGYFPFTPAHREAKASI